MQERPQDKTTSNVLLAVGVIMLLIGGLGARVGTHSIGLFIFYILLFLGGLGCVAAGRSIRNRKYE